jgi:hypothetical protein
MALLRVLETHEARTVGAARKVRVLIQATSYRSRNQERRAKRIRSTQQLYNNAPLPALHLSFETGINMSRLRVEYIGLE